MPRARVSRIIVWTNAALALAVIAPSFFTEAGSATGTTAQIGTLLLLLVLLPSNLRRFDWWGRKAWVRGLVRLRKPLGIGSGIWFVAHSVVALGFAYRERLESWVFGQAGDGRASADPVEVPRGKEAR